MPTVTSTTAPPISTIDDTLMSFSSGWSTSTNGAAYDGTYRWTGVVGASLTYNFYGDSLSIVYTSSSSRGNMSVYIDGILVDTFSQYSAGLVLQVQYDYAGALALGNHSLELSHAGPSGK